MSQFHLIIVTPDGEKYNGMAESLLVKTDSGDVEILDKHTDYFAHLATGRARIITPEEKTLKASCSGGVLSVSKSEVKLVATTFEFASEIDLQRATLAKERAEEAIRDAKDDVILRVAKAKLLRAVTRINVAENYKR